MSLSIRQTDSPTLRRIQQQLKHNLDVVSTAKLLAIGAELLARDLGIVKSPPVLNESPPQNDGLDEIYIIRVVRKLNGTKAYAIHEWKPYARKFKPIGEVHSGPYAFSKVYAARKELFAELRQQKEAEQS